MNGRTTRLSMFIPYDGAVNIVGVNFRKAG